MKHQQPAGSTASHDIEQKTGLFMAQHTELVAFFSMIERPLCVSSAIQEQKGYK
jgi:hypothetical protein